MFRIPSDRLDIIIDGFSDVAKNSVNYYELRDLFLDYIKNISSIKKGERINFSKFTDHLFDYVFVGSDGNKLMFRLA